jgi:hypothetical protein
MKTQILLAHLYPHLHGSGLLVLILLLGVILAVALVCFGNSKN